MQGARMDPRSPLGRWSPRPATCPPEPAEGDVAIEVHRTFVHFPGAADTAAAPRARSAPPKIGRPPAGSGPATPRAVTPAPTVLDRALTVTTSAPQVLAPAPLGSPGSPGPTLLAAPQPQRAWSSALDPDVPVAPRVAALDYDRHATKGHAQVLEALAEALSPCRTPSTQPTEGPWTPSPPLTPGFASPSRAGGARSPGPAGIPRIPSIPEEAPDSAVAEDARAGDGAGADPPTKLKNGKLRKRGKRGRGKKGKQAEEPDEWEEPSTPKRSPASQGSPAAFAVAPVTPELWVSPVFPEPGPGRAPAWVNPAVSAPRVAWAGPTAAPGPGPVPFFGVSPVSLVVLDFMNTPSGFQKLLVERLQSWLPSAGLAFPGTRGRGPLVVHSGGAPPARAAREALSPRHVVTELQFASLVEAAATDMKGCHGRAVRLRDMPRLLA